MLSKSTEPTIQSTADFKDEIAFNLDDAKFAMKISQARQFAYKQRRYTLPHYAVGDEVFLSRKLYTTATSKAQPSKKWELKRYVPFNGLDLIGKNAICVQLPNKITIQPS